MEQEGKEGAGAHDEGCAGDSHGRYEDDVAGDEEELEGEIAEGGDDEAASGIEGCGGHGHESEEGDSGDQRAYERGGSILLSGSESGKQKSQEDSGLKRKGNTYADEYGAGSEEASFEKAGGGIRRGCQGSGEDRKQRGIDEFSEEEDQGYRERDDGEVDIGDVRGSEVVSDDDFFGETEEFGSDGDGGKTKDEHQQFSVTRREGSGFGNIRW